MNFGARQDAVAGVFTPSNCVSSSQILCQLVTLRWREISSPSS